MENMSSIQFYTLIKFCKSYFNKRKKRKERTTRKRRKNKVRRHNRWSLPSPRRQKTGKDTLLSVTTGQLRFWLCANPNKDEDQERQRAPTESWCSSSPPPQTQKKGILDLIDLSLGSDSFLKDDSGGERCIRLDLPRRRRCQSRPRLRCFLSSLR